MAALSVKPRPPLEETSVMSVRDDDVLRPAREYQIISRPFAGRVGGNQHFTIEADTSEKDSLLQRIPDAAPYLTWRESFDLRPFREVELWKQAAVEGYGMRVSLSSIDFWDPYHVSRGANAKLGCKRLVSWSS